MGTDTLKSISCERGIGLPKKPSSSTDMMGSAGQ